MKQIYVKTFHETYYILLLYILRINNG